MVLRMVGVGGLYRLYFASLFTPLWHFDFSPKKYKILRGRKYIHVHQAKSRVSAAHTVIERPLVHSPPAHHPPFLLVLWRGCVLPLGWGWQRQRPNLQELYHRHSPNLFDKNFFRSCLAVQGLGLRVSKAGGVGSIPGLGTHIPHPTCHVEHPKRNLLIKTQNIAYFASLWPLYTIISSVQSLSRVQFSVTPWTAAHWASLSITNSRSSPKLMSIKSVMPFSHLILCHPLLLLPPILPSISLVFNSLHFYFLS